MIISNFQDLENPRSKYIEHRWNTTSNIASSINFDFQLDYMDCYEMFCPRQFIIEEIVKLIGARMKQIYFCASFNPHLLASLWELNDSPYLATLEKDQSLDHIIKHCTSLTDLELGWMGFNKGVSREKQAVNKSITCLKFNHYLISRDALRELSLRLPSLKQVFIKNSIIKSGDSALSDAKEQVVDMPNTVLQSLVFHLCGSSYFSIHLQVTTYYNEKDQYFRVIENKSMESSTAEKYQEILPQDKCLLLCIKCKDISHLSIKWHNGDQSYIDYYF